MNEQTTYERPRRYERPDIVFEGDLEIQAGSPLGVPDLEMEDLDF